MPEGPRKVRFVVPAADAGKRLDQVLAVHVPGLSRRKARLLLDIGGVFVERKRTKQAARLMREGDSVEAVLGGAFERAAPSTGRAARAKDEAHLPRPTVVHEDEDVLVVDKPAGLLTAPTPESDRNNLLGLLVREGARASLFVVHRIDLETSGLLVFAKTEDANRALSARFQQHDVDREYVAVVDGAFPEETRTVDRPVSGRRAVTHFAIDERIGTVATVLRARLETGRTHQIRLHARAVGHPVLGDPKYGAPTHHDPPRMALHATRLGFVHPRTGETLAFESPLPPDLAGWLEGLRAPSPLP